MMLPGIGEAGAAVRKIAVGIGSDYGDRRQAVEDALAWLSEKLKGFACSGIYETPPYGHKGSNYMNAVAVGFITLSPEDFESDCKEYELLHGRDSRAREAKTVPIDLDVVLADNDVLRPEDFKREFFQIGFRECRQYFEAL